MTKKNWKIKLTDAMTVKSDGFQDAKDHLQETIDSMYKSRMDQYNHINIKSAVDSNQNIFQEGEQLMNGDRDKSYGDFHQNFANIAKSWSLVLGIEVTPHQFGLCMAIMKIIREAYSHKRDNLVDGAVYLRMANEIMERAENEKIS